MLFSDKVKGVKSEKGKTHKHLQQTNQPQAKRPPPVLDFSTKTTITISRKNEKQHCREKKRTIQHGGSLSQETRKQPSYRYRISRLQVPVIIASNK